jgi:hypothetical protein
VQTFHRYQYAAQRVTRLQSQLVTANGSIIDATQQNHPNLFKALRGGNTNLGIVTAFEMKTIQNQWIWGGRRNYSIDHDRSIINTFVETGLMESYYNTASHILTFIFNGSLSTTVDLFNTDGSSYHPALEPFKQIPYTVDTTGVKKISQLSIENAENQHNGFRETYWTASYCLEIAIAHEVRNVFEREIVSLSHVAGIEARCILQVITSSTISKMTKAGGNCIGLDNQDAPLMLLNLAFRWHEEASDAGMMRAADQIVRKTTAFAEQHGCARQFLYMDYASSSQSVIDAYGPEGRAHLLQTAKEIDPQGIFQRLTSGPFKLSNRQNTMVTQQVENRKH